MRSALQTASELARERDGQLHLVLGEMRELGGYSHGAHSELGDYLATMSWASLFAIGDEMAPLVVAVGGGTGTSAGRHTVEHRQTAIGIGSALAPRLRPNDVVLVKGSRGVRTETVIAELLSERHP
jgi:UDP-N-acetylmuramoyl-tripeptide--D-alanyl-D-alanine ligase